MLLKRTDKKGNKYYIDAFTGQTVTIPKVNPLRREPDKRLQKLMNPGFSNGFFPGSIENNLKSAFIGKYKAIMRVKPRKRDKKEFIKICKRVNVNPYPIMNLCV